MALKSYFENEQFSTINSHQYSYNYSNDSTIAESIQSLSSTDLYGNDYDMANETTLNEDAFFSDLSDNHELIPQEPPGLVFDLLLNEFLEPTGTLCMEDLHENNGGMQRDYQNIGNNYGIQPEYPPIENNYETQQEQQDIVNDFGIQRDQDIGDLIDISAKGFDLTEYITKEDTVVVSQARNQFRAGRKKIDLQAQKYILDEDDENENKKEDNKEENHMGNIQNNPVLEACDLFSLLTKFEQLPDFPENFMQDFNSDVNVEQNSNKQDEPVQEEIKIEADKTQVKIQPEICTKEEIQVLAPVAEVKAPVKQHKTVPHCPVKPKKEIPVKPKKEIPVKPKKEIPVKPKKEISAKPKKEIPVKPQTVTNDKLIRDNIFINWKQARDWNQVKIDRDPSETQFVHPGPLPLQPFQLQPTQTPNRKVLNELPQDVISRISKTNAKRKTIAVIPPIPNRKRGASKVQENATPAKVAKLELVQTVQHDHSYSVKAGQQPVVKKETSVTEQNDRSIILKQPMVKNADGTLMVSLLKVNTIHSKEPSQKKKLGIEEYKKRRQVKLSSQSSSASSSSCNSPVPEDESTRIQKHQEKLMRMAKEVLNTRPKSEQKREPAVPLSVYLEEEQPLPNDMEMITYVSIGVNTEFKICKNLDPVVPVQQLEEIKPLLKKASNKFSCNSLINAVIENIPKVINNTIDVSVDKSTCSGEHGEDKTIVYLPKNRVPTKTRTVEVQTNISLVQQTKAARYRRRQSSESSSGSCSSASKHSLLQSRKRNDSNTSSVSSRSSKSSPYSSSQSRSESRSHSTSPRYSNWEQERVREVEERRVVYVGRISHKTTKEDLRHRFEIFGPITNISLHFRDHGYLDNYGFVTFANQHDAFAALEHGNDEPHYPKYDLSFGGRRQFCMTAYSDLDNMREDIGYYPQAPIKVSFDSLLKTAKKDAYRRHKT